VYSFCGRALLFLLKGVEFVAAAFAGWGFGSAFVDGEGRG